MAGKNIAFPYRRIPDDLPVVSDWFWRTTVDGEVHTENEVAGWDYDTDLILSRTLEVDVPKCLSAAGLDKSDGAIGVVVVIETGPGSYRWIAYQGEINGEEGGSQSIEIAVRGAKLAGGLRISTDLVLIDAGSEPGRLVATQTGSRLWSDSHQIYLEGSGSRFPMEMLVFRKSLPQLASPQALWYLYWLPEQLEGSFVGNVVLYLNAENKDFVASIVNREPLPLAWIRSDIVRQMCSRVMESEEFLENHGEYGKETLGGVIHAWLKVAFPDMTVSAVRALYNQDRSKFESVVQSAFGGAHA